MTTSPSVTRGFLVPASLIFLWLACSTPSPAPQPPTACASTGDLIDDYLATKNSPLAGQGQAFVLSGQVHDVDPRLIVAIAGAESSFGTRICTPFNAWNWFYTQTWCDAPFTSWAEGIERVTKGIAGPLYFQAGRTTIQSIGEIYTATERETWVNNVTRFYQDLGGNLEDFTFKEEDTPCERPPASATASITPGPTSTPAPGPTNTAPPPTAIAATPSPQPLLLRHICGRDYVVTADQAIQVFYGGWAVRGRDLAQQWVGNLVIDLTIDDLPIEGHLQPPSADLPYNCPNDFEDPYWLYYSALIPGLTPGTHQVTVTFYGLNALPDGYGGTYGPGLIGQQDFQISAR